MMNHIYHERNLPSALSEGRREEKEGNKGYLLIWHMLLTTTVRRFM